MEKEKLRRGTLRISSLSIITLMLQAGAILIWATQLDARVSGVEQQVSGTRNLNERFAALQERLDDVKQGMGDIKREVHELAEHLMRK